MKERYVQKEIVVDAFQVERDVEESLPAWLRDGRVSVEKSTDGGARVYGCAVRTPEGKMRAKVGDYIVREPDGSLRVLKASHFRSLYGFDGSRKGDVG